MAEKWPCHVLGAGLMGRLLAHCLVKQGHEVHIYEAGTAEGLGAAARVAASMLAPLAESAITESSVVDMGQYSLSRWPNLIEQLPAPVFFQQAGTLLLWHRADAQQARMLVNKLQLNSQTMAAASHPQPLQADQLAALEPELVGKFHQGLFLPCEGQLDNRQLLNALLASLETQKVHVHWNQAVSTDDFVDNASFKHNWVFDCRGLGAKKDWQSLRGVRGEVIRLHAPQVNITRPVRLVHPRYPLYIAPKQNHVYVIGATEIESDDSSNASVRSTLELLSATYSLHSGFAEARILEINTQLRPTLNDNLPSIRKLSSNCMQINGLYRHGFLIAPAIADAVLWHMQGDDTLAHRFGLFKPL